MKALRTACAATGASESWIGITAHAQRAALMHLTQKNSYKLRTSRLPTNFAGPLVTNWEPSHRFVQLPECAASLSDGDEMHIA
jgi:hypothetical protein